MPKVAKSLSAIEIKRLMSGTHPVGHVSGLTLIISEEGTRKWVLRTVVGAKRTMIGVGGHNTSLKDAVEKAKALKEQIHRGNNPVEERRKAKEELKNNQARTKTFSDCATMYLPTRKFANVKHGKQWLSSVDYINSHIGEKPVNDITVMDIHDTLQPIWYSTPETASRILGRIKVIIDYATTRGYRDSNKINPAVWTGNLSTMFESKKKLAPVKHHPFVPAEEMYIFVQHLKRINTISTKALELLTLIPLRSGSLRYATWEQIDFDKKLWTIPAENMKNKMEFITPLSSYAINLLKSMPKVHGTNLIFPGSRLQPISDNTLSKMMREMVSDGLITKGVPHGLRSSAQVYRRNFTNYSHEIGELTLSHKVGSEVSQSYNHGDALRHRMNFLEDWGKFCNTPFVKEVTIPNHLKIAS